MKEILQYIHYPNATELGEGKTHETYMLVPTSLDVSSLFPDKEEQKFFHQESGKTYVFKAAFGREYRINQLGQFYRDKNIKFGDAIVCTKVTENGTSKLYVAAVQGQYIGFIASSKGVEILNSSRLSEFSERSAHPLSLNVIYNDKSATMVIAFDKSIKKRNDSPIETDYYKCQIDGEDIKGTVFVDVGTKKAVNLEKKADLIQLTW